MRGAVLLVLGFAKGHVRRTQANETLGGSQDGRHRRHGWRLRCIVELGKVQLCIGRCGVFGGRRRVPDRLDTEGKNTVRGDSMHRAVRYLPLGVDGVTGPGVVRHAHLHDVKDSRRVLVID